MAKIKPSPEMLEGILARVPEGFLHKQTLLQKLKLHNKAADNVQKALEGGKVGRVEEYYFDPQRITAEQVLDYSQWCRPAFPSMSSEWLFLTPSINEQREMRRQQLGHNPAVEAMLQRLQTPPFYAPVDDLIQSPQDAELLQDLLGTAVLRRYKDVIFDATCLSWNTVQEVIRRREILPLYQQLLALLDASPGHTLALAEIAQRFGSENITNLLSMDDDITTFSIAMKRPPYSSNWVRLKSSDHDAALKAARENVKIRDEEWAALLPHLGDVLRAGARAGVSPRMQVLARSYQVGPAAKRLGVKPETLQRALDRGVIPIITDPEGKPRLAARDIEGAVHDVEQMEAIAGYENLRSKEISLVTGLSFSAVRYRLKKLGVARGEPAWAKVRGKMGLPETLREFRQLLDEKIEQRRDEIQARLEEERQRVRAERAAEEARREALRDLLVASFPAWRHARRAEQRIILHAGPPNSGKTHDAIQALADAGSGWYLAPLRLLAFEIFDRLNQRGVACNLLTGEEHVPVPGAQITAATVEMFDPARSGDCVIIDEAQMLADADRGWAWTRALMEAQAPEIHVIGPLTAVGMIEKLAHAAAIPLTVQQHERLAPIRVAESAWPVNRLPARTILVAFSRQMVLQLKTDLEHLDRKVSVVYGSLPPEVRRKQSDRFANGETEICVATDAVGMGLNLPADYVCFFEVEKFDGHEVRELYTSEVQQIGGRAGRFGFSQAGEVGATTKRDLQRVRRLFEGEPQDLTHARVAPTVTDMALIPGSLHQRLTQWAALESIPESLRGAIKTADLSERIELAKMLTDREVQYLGLEAGMRLINAPTRQNTRAFWRSCASNIIAGEPMPVPPYAPSRITSNFDLESTEASIACSDIYLWLGSRREFETFAPDEDHVRNLRTYWSEQIDQALLHRLDLSKRCASCGVQLSSSHRYRICDNCYAERMGFN